jgi:hypothetical protein
MENLQNLLDAAKNLIADGKTLEALELLLGSQAAKSGLIPTNTLIMLKHRCVIYKYEKFMNTGPDNTEPNKINAALLSFIDDIANKNKIKLEVTESETISGKAANDTASKALGRELTLNYFTVSFSDRYLFKDGELNNLAINDIAHKVLHSDLSNFFINERQKRLCRNIFVIGAGATYNNFKELPFGDEMRDVLYKELEVEDYLKKIEKFKAGTREAFEEAKNTLNFEKYISFLSKTFDKEKIKQLLKKYYGVRHLPCLSYEIIAHLLKHGFIDVVINFNFDELLDQAIEEELGQGNYHKIVSDGDVIPLSNIVVNGSIKIPVYIKAHGTASNKSTLNLTQDNYFEIPREVSALIEELVAGKREKLDPVPIVNVTCIGYSMQSKQFNAILEEHLSKEAQIFNININPEPSSRNDTLDKLRKGFVNLAYIEPKDGLSSFDLAMLYLWKDINSYFNTAFQPRQISRHEIISNIFYEYNVVGVEKYENKKENDKMLELRKKLSKYFEFGYFIDRVIIEIGILIAKNKGILDFHEMMPERLGNYYHLYRQKNDQISKQNEFDQKEKDFTTLYEIARGVFGMKPKYDFSGNLLIFQPVVESELPIEIPEWLVILANGHKVHKAILEEINKTKGAQILFRYFLNGRNIPKGEIIERILNGLAFGDETRKRTVRTKIEATLTHLNGLVEDFVYDINAKFEDRKLYRFRSFSKKKILHTNLALNYEILSKFIQVNTGQNNTNSNSDWSTLLMVSERGKTIKKSLDRMELAQLNALNGKKIIMVCSYEVAHEEVLNLGLAKPKNIAELEVIYKSTFVDAVKCSKDDSKEIAIRNIINGIKILFIPYREHSNHMMLFMCTNQFFLRKDRATIQVEIEDKCNQEDPLFVGIDSVYYYKKGVANKIN